MKTQGLHKLNNLLESVNLRNQELLSQLQSEYKSRSPSPQKFKIQPPLQTVEQSEIIELQQRNHQLVEDLNFLNLSYKELKIGTDEMNSKNQQLKKHIKELLQTLKHKEDELKKVRDRVRNGESIEDSKTQEKSIVDYAIYMEKQFQNLEDKVKKYKRMLEKNGIDEQFTKKVEEQRKMLQSVLAEKEQLSKEFEGVQHKLTDHNNQREQLIQQNNKFKDQIQNSENLHIQEIQLKDRMIDKLNNQLIKQLDHQNTINDTKTQNQQLQNQLSDLNKQIKELEQSHKKLHTHNMELNQQIQVMQRDNILISKDNQQLKQQLIFKDEEYSRLIVKKQKEIQQIRQQEELKTNQLITDKQLQSEMQYNHILEKFNLLQTKIVQLEETNKNIKFKVKAQLLRLFNQVQQLKLEQQQIIEEIQFKQTINNPIQTYEPICNILQQQQQLLSQHFQTITVISHESEQKESQQYLEKTVEIINLVLENKGQLINFKSEFQIQIAEIHQFLQRQIQTMYQEFNDKYISQQEAQKQQIDSLVSDLNNQYDQLYQLENENTQLKFQIESNPENNDRLVFMIEQLKQQNNELQNQNERASQGSCQADTDKGSVQNKNEFSKIQEKSFKKDDIIFELKKKVSQLEKQVQQQKPEKQKSDKKEKLDLQKIRSENQLLKEQIEQYKMVSEDWALAKEQIDQVHQLNDLLPQLQAEFQKVKQENVQLNNIIDELTIKNQDLQDELYQQQEQYQNEHEHENSNDQRLHENNEDDSNLNVQHIQHLQRQLQCQIDINKDTIQQLQKSEESSIAYRTEVEQLKIQIHDQSQKIQELIENDKTTGCQISETKIELTKTTADLIALQKYNENLNKTIEQSHKQQLLLQEQINQIELENQEKNTLQIKTYNEQLDKLQQIHEKNKQELSILEKQNSTSQGQIQQLQIQIDSLLKQNQYLQDQNSQLISGQEINTQDLLTQIQSLKLELESNQQQRQQLVKKIFSKEKEIVSLKSDIQNLQQSLENQASQIQELSNNGQIKDSSISETKNELTKTKADLTAQQKYNENLNHIIDQSNQQQQLLQEEINRIKQENQIQAEQFNNTQNQQLNDVLNQNAVLTQDLEQQILALNETISQLQTSANNLQQQNQDLQDKNSNLFSEQQINTQRLLEQISNLQQELDLKLKVEQQSKSQVDEQLFIKEQEIDQVTSEVQNLTLKMQQQASQIEDLKDSNLKQDQNMNEAKIQLIKTNADLTALQKYNENLNQTIQQNNKQYELLQEEMNKIKLENNAQNELINNTKNEQLSDNLQQNGAQIQEQSNLEQQKLALEETIKQLEIQTQDLLSQNKLLQDNLQNAIKQQEIHRQSQQTQIQNLQQEQKQLINQLNEQILVKDQEIVSLKSEIQNLNQKQIDQTLLIQELKDNDSKKDEIISEIKNQNIQAIASAEQHKEQLKQNIEQSNNQQQLFQEEMQKIKSENQEFKTLYKNTQNDQLNLQKYNELYKNEIQALESQKQISQETIIQLQIMVDGLQTKNSYLQESNKQFISGQEIKSQDLFKKIQKLESNLAGDQQLNQQLVEKLQVKGEEIEQLKADVQKLQKENEELINNIEDLSDSNENLKQQSQRFQILYSEKDEKQQQLNEIIYQNNIQLQEKEKKINILILEVDQIKKKLINYETVFQMNEDKLLQARQRMYKIKEKIMELKNQGKQQIDQFQQFKAICLEQVYQLYSRYSEKVNRDQKELEETVQNYENDIGKLKKQLNSAALRYDELFASQTNLTPQNHDIVMELKSQLEKQQGENDYCQLQINTLKEQLEQKTNQLNQQNASLDFSNDMSSIDNIDIKNFNHSSINNATIIDPTVQSAHTKSSQQIFQSQFAQQLQQNDNNYTKLVDMQQENDVLRSEIEKYKVNLLDYQQDEINIQKKMADQIRDNQRLRLQLENSDLTSFKAQIKQLVQSLLFGLKNQATETSKYLQVLMNMIDASDTEKEKFEDTVNTILKKKNSAGFFK